MVCWLFGSWEGEMVENVKVNEENLAQLVKSKRLQMQRMKKLL
jgi:hypothetical protein